MVQQELLGVSPTGGGGDEKPPTCGVRAKPPGTPFVPGGDARRNLAGRPKLRPQIPDILRNLGKEHVPADLEGVSPAVIRSSKTMLEALMRATYARALAGDQWAVQFIADRTEGKVTDRIQVEGGQPLVVVEQIVASPQDVPGRVIDVDPNVA